MTHPHDHPVRAELQSLDQRRADTLADALRPDDAPTGDAHERRATLLRTVDTRGVTRDVLVTLVWSATDARPARQRVIYGRAEAVIDTDSEDPREAVCRWGNFCLAEIRGPGEAITAEHLAARDAEIARLESVCDDLQTAWLTASAERDAARDQLAAVTADVVRAEQERDAALATVRTLNADIAAAAGELLVPIPTPGSDAARLLRANIILRQERDEARAERRAARLDRDAAEERVAELQRLVRGAR